MTASCSVIELTPALPDVPGSNLMSQWFQPKNWDRYWKVYQRWIMGETQRQIGKSMGVTNGRIHAMITDVERQIRQRKERLQKS